VKFVGLPLLIYAGISESFIPHQQRTPCAVQTTRICPLIIFL